MMTKGADLMSMEINPTARSPADLRAASVDVHDIRRNIRRRYVLSLIVATLIVIAEMAVVGSSVGTARRPRAGHGPVEASAFVFPPQPPSDLLVGGKIRTG